MKIDKYFESRADVILADGVFVFKNFYENPGNLLEDLENMSEQEWRTHGNIEPGDSDIEFWNNNTSLDLIPKDFHDKVIILVAPYFWPLSHGNMIRIKPEHGSMTHGFLKSEYPYIKYMVGYYLGEFDGGEILFPELNISYKPNQNELILIDAKHDYIVEEVSSGTRYSYLDYLIEHPGYRVI